jgi:Restriction endonuclease XhoI
VTPELLPKNFEGQIKKAIETFWRSKGSALSVNSQGGARGSVLGGKNMDGFVSLVEAVAVHCGFPVNSVHVRKSKVVLPGFFRATKNWDVLVIHEKRLLGVFEFKSQVGSFGNNFNNRAEEVIGSAADLWVAHHHGAYGFGSRQRNNRIAEATPAVLNPVVQADPRPPFVAWLMLLEECDDSLSPVRCEEPNYPVFEEFQGASYARRYQILCERLVERQLYTAAALELTKAGSRSSYALSPATSILNLFKEFSGKLLASQ